MSFFLNQESLTTQDVSEQRLELAEFQYDSMMNLLETLRLRCATKCVPIDYGEGDLTKGELECTQRCVAKFMESHKVIGNWVERGRHLTDKDMPVYQNVKRKYLNTGAPEK
ncbi:Tim12 protein [Martiniozyma asiatica (nom. inval.)]|nr:Tim12 protein [Martiniozyma asiatica]